MPSPAFKQPMDFSAWEAEERRVRDGYKNDLVRFWDFEIPGQDRDVPARGYQRLDIEQPQAVVVWFHGGAFVVGSLEMPEGHLVGMELALRSGALVVSVDYELVNDEVKFPCCQRDALSALSWALEKIHELGLGENKLFVGGASAGACLTGSLGLMARDRGVKLGGLMPIYPVAHANLPEFSDEIKSAIEGIFAFDQDFSRLHNPWLVEGLTEAELSRWHCFPGDTLDKSGQAKMLVIQAQRDSLRASGDLWIQQLMEAGVEVTQLTLAGAEHGFLNRNSVTDPHANQTITLMADFVNGGAK